MFKLLLTQNFHIETDTINGAGEANIEAIATAAASTDRCLHRPKHPVAQRWWLRLGFVWRLWLRLAGRENRSRFIRGLWFGLKRRRLRLGVEGGLRLRCRLGLGARLGLGLWLGLRFRLGLWLGLRRQ